MELGFDGLGAGLVDGLDRLDRGLVVLGLGDLGEFGEGEAVDLADEDGGHRGIEEVFEEGFCELVVVLWCVCVHCAPFGRFESGGGELRTDVVVGGLDRGGVEGGTFTALGLTK